MAVYFFWWTVDDRGFTRPRRIQPQDLDHHEGLRHEAVSRRETSDTRGDVSSFWDANRLLWIIAKYGRSRFINQEGCRLVKLETNCARDTLWVFVYISFKRIINQRKIFVSIFIFLNMQDVSNCYYYSFPSSKASISRVGS